jgi:hypothetical protein
VKAIWKFSISDHLYQQGMVTDRPAIPMPKGAEILTVQVQRDEAQVWAIVDSDAPVEPRTLVIVGTGQPMPDDLGRYVGTWQAVGGHFVFHVFEAQP